MCCDSWGRKESDTIERLNNSNNIVFIAALLQEGKKLEAFWDWANKSSCSVAQSCLTLWDPVACRTLGLRVHHQLQKRVKDREAWHAAVHRVAKSWA